MRKEINFYMNYINKEKYVILPLFFILLYKAFVIATAICDTIKIPYDFALNIYSIGFRVELTIIICIIMTYIIYKIEDLISDLLLKLMY